MVSLVIYGVIAITLASMAGYAFLTFTNTTKQATYVQENYVRMDAAVAALRLTMVSAGPSHKGFGFMPMGVTAADANHVTYTQLPPLLGAVGQTPWGQPYLYCPVSQTQTTTLPAGLGGTLAVSTVQSPSGATYNVHTYIGPFSANSTYVLSNGTFATLNAGQYAAFIISSTGPGQTIPDCSQIVVSGKSVTVPGGVVRAVAAVFPWEQSLAVSNDRMEFYVSNSSSGDGTGRDVNNLTTLDYALNMWVSLQPLQTNIYLAGGTVYGIATDLNAESPSGTVKYPLAQGQNSHLTIATMPGGAALATIDLSSAVMLTSATSFINVNIQAASTLTTIKPLFFKNVSYASAQQGLMLNIIGTSFLAQKSCFSNTAINSSNATLEFYQGANCGSTSAFSDSQLAAVQSQISFDGSAGSVATYNFTGNATTNYPLSLLISSMTVGTTAAVNISNSTDSVLLNSSSLNVAGSMTLSGGASLGALDAFAGSSIDIPTGGVLTVAQSAGAMPFGLFLRNSKVSLEGTLSTNGLNAGAVAISQGEFTGTNSGANLIDGQPLAYPCLYLVNAAGGNAVPVYLVNPLPQTGYPVFTTVQKGYQPLVGDTTNAYLLQSQASAALFLNTTKTPVNDPLVINSKPLNAIATATPQVIGYVDAMSLENGVRDLVNLESIIGVSLNFSGACRS